jgi:hypothetical protein
MVFCKPVVIESSATMAAMPMTTPNVVNPALSFRSLMALNE